MSAKLHDVREADRDDAEQAVLRFYSSDEGVLAPEGKRLLALLDDLDLLVAAIENDAVDEEISRNWLRTVLGPGKTVESGFLRQLQQCCEDQEIYNQLERLIDAR